MSWIDLILNIAGLLLWLNWRAVPLSVPPAGVSIISTVRPAGPSRSRRYYLVALLVLLCARAFFYRQIGEPINWNPGLQLGPTTIAFRSDHWGRMLIYSFCSFGLTLAIFYLFLLLLSWIHSRAKEPDPSQRMVSAHLGFIGRLPNTIKFALPLLLAVILWCALNPLLVRSGLVPRNSSGWHVIAQGAIIGAGAYLTLKFFLVPVLALYLLNSYVYLGEFPFWKFIDATARGLIRPIKWLPLRVGKIDFTPVILIAAVIAVAQFGQPALTELFRRLI